VSCRQDARKKREKEGAKGDDTRSPPLHTAAAADAVAAARAGASSRGGSSVVGSASETDTSASREDDDLDDYFIKDGCVDVDDAVVEGPRSRGLVGLVTARALC